ncbi:MAG: hypothetical protein IPP74_13935 [Alphaproteobacteria bacterium]|nr:hypothetical protein [Alphaproteobacteria bacterium]
MTDEVVNDLAMDVRRQMKNTTIHQIQTSTLDQKRGLLTSSDRYQIEEG